MRTKLNVHLAVLRLKDIGSLCNPRRVLTVKDEWTVRADRVTCELCIQELKAHATDEVFRELDPKPMIVRCKLCGHKIKNPKPTDGLRDPYERELFG